MLLMALALIMLMGAFIKLCSMHTPTNNPNMPKHKEFPGKFAQIELINFEKKTFFNLIRTSKIQEWPLFWLTFVFHHGVGRLYDLRNP